MCPTGLLLLALTVAVAAGRREKSSGVVKKVVEVVKGRSVKDVQEGTEKSKEGLIG